MLSLSTAKQFCTHGSFKYHPVDKSGLSDQALGVETFNAGSNHISCIRAYNPGRGR
jgi:hypothetical protein